MKGVVYLLKSKIDASYYYKALIKLSDKYKNNQTSRDFYKKYIFYGVKAINHSNVNKYVTYDDVKQRFNLICLIKNTMSKITPKEFETIFPIQKIYDGEKWESKDYFYTKKYLGTLNSNEPIGDVIDELLWEYVNIDTRIFNTQCFMTVDKLRRFEGKISMMEEWANLNNIETYSLRKDTKGKEYLYNKKTGRTIRVIKPRPKYLKLLK